MSGKLFQAPFLAAHPGFELYGVAERTEQRMKLDYPNIRSYPSVAEVLADSTIELVVVNTPSNTHFDLASQALRAGKHVLLEKPVATSVAQLQELLALAKQRGRHLLAYQNRRWDSDFGAVRRVVQSGQLGHRGRHRFLEQHVLAGAQGLAGQLEMRGAGRVHHHQLHGGIGQQLGYAAEAPDVGVIVLHAGLGALHHGVELEARVRGQKGSLKEFARHAVGQQRGANGSSSHARKIAPWAGRPVRLRQYRQPPTISKVAQCGVVQKGRKKENC